MDSCQLDRGSKVILFEGTGKGIRGSRAEGVHAIVKEVLADGDILVASVHTNRSRRVSGEHVTCAEAGHFARPSSDTWFI